jgi:DNA-binding transcriptional MerR regulator
MSAPSRPATAKRAATSGPLGPRPRSYYSIGEVCEMLDLKPHVLRYWETQFKELSPFKNRSGNRVYRPEDIELISLIQQLVHDQRYTLEGARHRLGELKEQGDAGDEVAASLEQSVLRTLQAELEELLVVLDPKIG